jgi:hypothetical protein
LARSPLPKARLVKVFCAGQVAAPARTAAAATPHVAYLRFLD